MKNCSIIIILLLFNLFAKPLKTIAHPNKEFTTLTKTAKTINEFTSLGQWSKVYGDELDNRPSKIKAFGDGVYVAGYQDVNGKIFATVSKFDIQDGALQWQRSLDFPSRISDFAYDADNETLIVVGAEGALTMGATVIAANRSFMMVLDDDGNPEVQKFYDRQGPEGFTRIVRHQNPKNPLYPYYVLGRVNDSSNPNPDFDLPVLYNIDENLEVNWIHQYEANVEVEAFHLLIPLHDGELFIGGKASGLVTGTSMEGVLIEIDGATGQHLESTAYPAGIDLYDGLDMGIGTVAIAGHDIEQDMGIVFIIDRNTHAITDGLRFPDVSGFREIGMDAFGSIFTLGRKKSGPDHFHILHQLAYANTGEGYMLGAMQYRYLFDDESNFDEPHIYVTPGHDAIFYTDARRGNPNGFGNYDILAASFGLAFENDCVVDYQQFGQSFNANNFSFTITSSSQNEALIPLGYDSSPITYYSNEFCQLVICDADFSWTSECGVLNLTEMANGLSPFDFQWDIDCDNTIDATGPNPAISNLEPGSHQVCLIVTDAAECVSSTQQTVFVQGDFSPPIIDCPPPPAAVAIPACENGATVNFGTPFVSDDCSMVSLSATHQSGDFFSCGYTNVTYTATDEAGNQSSCSFQVQVNCQCAEAVDNLLECTEVEGQYLFTADVNILNDAGEGNCTINLSSIGTSVMLNDTSINITGTYPNFSITALVDIAIPPVPDSILLFVDVNCVCDAGNESACGLALWTPLPCCKEITVGLQEVCRDEETIEIPLIGCDNLYDVEQVRWYVVDAPCPPSFWGEPIQVTNECAPLNLSPRYHDKDICVYAEVDMGPDAGSCNTLSSNIATINLCGPIGCRLSESQAFCWMGESIVPDSIELELIPPVQNCNYTIEWYDPDGNLIPSATGLLGYQPPPLDFTLADTICNQSYTYTVVVSNICGTQSCSSTIRLDNEGAPIGVIELLPPDVNPICHGEDAILEYTAKCGSTSGSWGWFLRPVSEPSYTAVVTNGSFNPFYYTNRLYEDTWVKVEERNGVCPPGDVEYLIDIIEPLTIESFSAEYSPFCGPSSVDMEVAFSPSPAQEGCSYTVYWYKGINLINTSTHTSSTATYTFTPPNVFGLPGNYYCIIESDCCPGKVKSEVVVLEPPIEVFALGPCFRCNCDTIMVTGIILNYNPEYTYKYRWYNGEEVIAGATDSILVVDPGWDGPFTFEVAFSYDGNYCVMSDTYFLRQCGSCDMINLPEGYQGVAKMNAVVYPTPTTGQVTVEMDQPMDFELLELFDSQGRVIQKLDIYGHRQNFTVDLSHLPPGNYILRGVGTEQEVLLEQLIKQ